MLEGTLSPTKPLQFHLLAVEKQEISIVSYEVFLFYRCLELECLVSQDEMQPSMLIQKIQLVGSLNKTSSNNHMIMLCNETSLLQGMENPKASIEEFTQYLQKEIKIERHISQRD